MSDDNWLEQWLDHETADFHRFEADEAVRIRQALLDWYRQHRRKLPWRGDAPPWDGSTVGFASKVAGKKKQSTLDTFIKVKQEPPQEPTFPVTAYGVWVSEIMLQQTRVEAVIPYWVRWMKSFPTVEVLAAADDETINAHWAGLGFYRRARLLHAAAKRVVEEYNGELPTTVEGLTQLDGIGRYTASAIASIAFGVTVPVVDGNVCRVLSRLRAIAQNVKDKALKDEYGWALAEQIVSAGDGSAAGEVNQALMELGATYCAPSGTGVDPGDPLRESYWSTRLGRELAKAQQDEVLATKLQACREGTPEPSAACPICAKGGVVQIVNNLYANFEEEPTVDPSMAGHAVFPLAPPKMHKREEAYAVGAISCHVKDGELWLLVRRPSKGLLAGQWELPSALVWTSEPQLSETKKGKRKDMSDQVPKISSAVRRKSLDELLVQVAADKDGDSSGFVNTKRVAVGNGPIEHVFSHVRHTLWIEHGHYTVSELDQTAWTDSTGREVRWMHERDMRQVGVTSGVKKILKAVAEQRKETQPPSPKKRRKK